MLPIIKNFAAAVAMGAVALTVSATAQTVSHSSFGVGGGFNPASGTNLGNANSIQIMNGGEVVVTSADPYDLQALVKFGDIGTLKDMPSLSTFTPIMGYLSLSSGVSLDLLSLDVSNRAGGPPGFLNLSGESVLHAPGFDPTNGVLSWTGTTTDNLTFSFALETSANSKPVPEPLSLGMLAVGLAGIALRRRRSI